MISTTRAGHPAEGQLQERLRALFDIQTVGIIFWGEDFGITHANGAFLKMTGFSLDEALGKTWQDLTPGEFRDASLKAVHDVTTRGETTPYEKQYFRKDGSRWWGLFAARRIGNEVAEFVLDVTERRQAEEQVREREEQLQLIINSASDYAILTLDTNGHVASWSPGAAATFGYTAAEIIGRPGAILFTPEDQAHGVPQQELETAREEGRAPDVRWHLRKDGSRVFVDGSSHVLRSREGSEIGFLKIARDETGRRRAEDELRTAEERYRLAAHATTDIIWDWDLTSDRIIWNEALYASFGYLPAQVSPSGDWWKSIIHPDDRERVVSSILHTIESDGPSWDAEYRIARSDGSYAEVLDRGTVIRDNGGTAVRMVGAIHDLTEHKKSEQLLRQMNETLEQKVIEEVASRLRTEDALRQSQKMEAIGQLTGGVAHDFNNLLTVIRGGAEMLKRPELSETKRTRYVEAISETAERAAKLTGQLLAFARRQALKPEIFDARDRIRGIVDMLRTIVGSRIELVTNTECDTCFIEADAAQFETALVNMAVNARDAMHGEGKLTISIGHASAIPQTRGHGRAEGPFVAVEISDTGHGIPDERLRSIFEPFFTTKEVGKGTGLGLSQVYGFAKQSGGDVDVKSEVGRGTTFTLFLPRVEAPAERREENGAPSSGRATGHILVVEDNEQVGAFSTDLLEESGFETSWAPNADAALKLLEEGPSRYAVVFSDVVMPGMSGLEMARIIRDKWPGLPVILTSGYSHILAEDARHGFQLLQKPYSVQDLTRVLKEAILRRS